jgi:hypothetical protein
LPFAAERRFFVYKQSSITIAHGAGAHSHLVGGGAGETPERAFDHERRDAAVGGVDEEDTASGALVMSAFRPEPVAAPSRVAIVFIEHVRKPRSVCHAQAPTHSPVTTLPEDAALLGLARSKLFTKSTRAQQASVKPIRLALVVSDDRRHRVHPEPPSPEGTVMWSSLSLPHSRKARGSRRRNGHAVGGADGFAREIAHRLRQKTVLFGGPAELGCESKLDIVGRCFCPWA